MLRHPIYAGAYTDGRRPIDPKRKFSSGKGYRPWVPMEQWKVLIKDHHPAYISWDQYLQNRKQIEAEPQRGGQPGCPTPGDRAAAGRLGLRQLRPAHASDLSRQRHGPVRLQSPARRSDRAALLRAGGQSARRTGRAQVLRALEPAALELSLKARADVERERAASRPTLAATTPAGALRRRSGRTPLPGGRSRQPPGGGDSGKALGRNARSATASPGGIRAVRARDARATERGRPGTHHGPRFGHSRLVECPEHDERRSQTDPPLPGRARRRARALRQ